MPMVAETFEECYEALNGSRDGIEDIIGDTDVKATYIQGKVAKTDFAYELGSILEKQRENAVNTALNDLDESQQNDPDTREQKIRVANTGFATALKAKLPPYIVEAIEHVTAPIDQDIRKAEETEGAQPA